MQSLLSRWKNLPTVVRVWFQPLLLVSVLLHSLLLNAPLPPEPEPEPEPEIPTETVKITSLVAPSSQPTPEPVAAPQPEVTPAAPPEPEAIAELPPEPAPIEEEVFEEEIVEEEVQLEEEEVVEEEEIPEEEEVAEEEEIPEEPEAETDNSEASAEAGFSLIEVLKPKILNRLAQSSNDIAAMEEVVNNPPWNLAAVSTEPFLLSGMNPPQLREGAFGSLAIPQESTSNAYFNYIEPVLIRTLDKKIEICVSITQI